MKINKTEIGKIIYLASPYSHPDKDVRHNNFVEVSKKAATLVAEGHVVFAPITYGHTLVDFHSMPTDANFWIGFCLSFLKHSDELWVYMMPGYDVSKGVAEEVEFAIENGIPVKYIEHESHKQKENHLTAALA